jgi:hypothetical protein
MDKITHKKCIIEGCNGLGSLSSNGKRYYYNGYCSKHYSAKLRYGDSSHEIRPYGNGRVQHPLYIIHRLMKERCYREKTKNFNNYGGRGIKVCDRWLGIHGFSNFLEDMGERPDGVHKNGRPIYTLDRIDNNKGYCKDNCRWATIHEQSGNKRSNNQNVGVRFRKDRNSWVARLAIDNKVYVKEFKKMEDAIAYRKELEIKYINNDKRI